MSTYKKLSEFILAVVSLTILLLLKFSLPLFAQDAAARAANEAAHMEDWGVDKNKAFNLTPLLQYLERLKPTPENIKENANEHSQVVEQIKATQQGQVSSQQPSALTSAKKQKTNSKKPKPDRAPAIPPEVPIVAFDEGSLITKDSDPLQDQADLKTVMSQIKEIFIEPTKEKASHSEQSEETQTSVIASPNTKKSRDLSEAKPSTLTSSEKSKTSVSLTPTDEESQAYESSSPSAAGEVSSEKSDSKQSVNQPSVLSTQSEGSLTAKDPDHFMDDSKKDPAPFNYAATKEDGSSKYANYESTHREPQKFQPRAYDPFIASTSYDSKMPYTPLEDARRKEQESENAKKETATKQSTFVSVNVQEPRSKAQVEYEDKLKEYELEMKTQKKENEKNSALLEEYRKVLTQKSNQATPSDLNKNETPLNIQTQAKSPASATQAEPALDFFTQHKLVLESIGRMLSNRDLQDQKPELIYNDIIRDIVVPELEKNIKDSNVAQFSKTLSIISQAEEPQSKNYFAPTSAFEVVDQSLENERKENSETVKISLDDAIGNLALGGDEGATLAISSLEKANTALRQILAITKKKNISYIQLIDNVENTNHLPYTRFAMLKLIIAGIQDGKIPKDRILPQALKEMLTFLNEYQDKIMADKDALPIAMEFSGCTSKESLLEDFKKIKKSLQYINDIDVAMMSKDEKEAYEEDNSQKTISYYQELFTKLMKQSENIQNPIQRNKVQSLCKEGDMVCKSIMVEDKIGNPAYSGKQ